MKVKNPRRLSGPNYNRTVASRLTEVRYKMGNENYRRTHQKAARQAENTARKRVMKKIDNEKASRAKEALEKNLARSLARIAKYELREVGG